MKNGTLVEKFFYKDTGKEIKINGKNKKIIQKIDLKGKNINTVTGNYTNVGLYVKGDSEVVSGKKFKYKGDTILWTKVKKTWKETNKSHPFSDLITLLNSHPEGVYLHYKNGSSEHGIVITRYEKKKDGGYQLYAIDPSNVRTKGTKEMKLQDTYFYKHDTFTAGIKNFLKSAKFSGTFVYGYFKKN